MKAEVGSQANHTRISLDGRFDFDATREFRAAVIEALRQNQTVIRIDLAAVEYIDSSALGMLLMAKEMAVTVGKTVMLANAKGNVGKVLDFAKFKNIFEIV